MRETLKTVLKAADQNLNVWRPVEFTCGHVEPAVFAFCPDKTCIDRGTPTEIARRASWSWISNLYL